MARKSKIPRYEDFNKAPNAFGRRAQEPRKWDAYLDPSRNLNLELGCGKAELLLGLARTYPTENFIGVDLKADRLWKASKNALKDSLENTAFLQANILEIAEFFKPHSVDLIWITHPDPFPKARQAKHRMLNRNFLTVYKKILKKSAVVRFKTDNKELFYWALEYLVLQKDIILLVISFDLHASEIAEDRKIITHYEKKFMDLDQPIYFLEFEFNS